MGIQPPSPDQRTWMIFDSSGSMRRKAVTVSGAASSSKRAVNEKPEALISSIARTLVHEAEVALERAVRQIANDLGLCVDLRCAVAQEGEKLPTQPLHRSDDGGVIRLRQAEHGRKVDAVVSGR